MKTLTVIAGQFCSGVKSAVFPVAFDPSKCGNVHHFRIQERDV